MVEISFSYFWKDILHAALSIGDSFVEALISTVKPHLFYNQLFIPSSFMDQKDIGHGMGKLRCNKVI